MQKAEVVLSMLGQKAKEDSTFVFDRLYRNLFNSDFYLTDKPDTGPGGLGVWDKPILERHQVLARLAADKCELCGNPWDSTNTLEVHHARSLKDIKQKYAKRGRDIPQWVLRMSSLRRKTLVVCEKCHDEIHAGTSTKNFREML
jgi:AI2M/AI1M-like HNH endonuclease